MSEIFRGSACKPDKRGLQPMLPVWSMGELSTFEQDVWPGQEAVRHGATPPPGRHSAGVTGATTLSRWPPRNERSPSAVRESCPGQVYGRPSRGAAVSRARDLAKCGKRADPACLRRSRIGPTTVSEKPRIGHFGPVGNRLTQARTWPISPPCPTTKPTRRARARSPGRVARFCARSSPSSRWCSAFARNALPASAVGPTVPDAPTISGITIGQNTVSVDFDANADGGAAITGFSGHL